MEHNPLTMQLGQSVGLVLAFALALIPSGLFVGLLLGGALKLATWLRWATTILVAAWLAHEMVFTSPPVGIEPEASVSNGEPWLWLMMFSPVIFIFVLWLLNRPPR